MSIYNPIVKNSNFKDPKGSTSNQGNTDKTEITYAQRTTEKPKITRLMIEHKEEVKNLLQLNNLVL